MVSHISRKTSEIWGTRLRYGMELKSATVLARRLGTRALLSRFLWPGLRLALLRSRTLLAFLRGWMLHFLNWTLHLRCRSLHLLNGTLQLRFGSLHLLDRTLDLRVGTLYLRGRARRLLPDWLRTHLGGRPSLLHRSSGMCLHRLDRTLWLVWP